MGVGKGVYFLPRGVDFRSLGVKFWFLKVGLTNLAYYDSVFGFWKWIMSLVESIFGVCESILGL